MTPNLGSIISSRTQHHVLAHQGLNGVDVLAYQGFHTMEILDFKGLHTIFYILLLSTPKHLMAQEIRLRPT
jgi:hypothetical protein